MPFSARAQAVAFVCVFSIVFGLVPHPASAAGRGTVRVGLLNPSAGPTGPEGAEVLAGFEYYLATHGDRLGGFSVEIRTGDEGQTVDAALATAHQLVEQDSVDAIVGILNSSDAYGIADYLDDRKVPVVITGAGADELTQGKARKTFFRVGHTSSQDVMPLGDYVCRRAGKRRVALVGVDAPYGWEAVGGFARAYADAGCRIVQEQYGAAGSDWSAVAGKIDRSADAVFAVVGGADSTAFLSAYRAAGLRQTLFGDGLLTDERVLANERDNALGVVTALHYTATLPTRLNTWFRLGYEGLSNRPVSYFVENGFAAAQALADALARLPSGAVHGEALAESLRAVDIVAPRGTLRFDGYQQAVNDVYVRRVTQVGGRYRNEVIATYSKVSQFWRYDPQKYLQMPTYSKLKGSWVKT